VPDSGSLTRSSWDCKYHVVFIPKYRKKRLFGQSFRYHVEFGDEFMGPCLDNLYGILKEAFASKTDTCSINSLDSDYHFVATLKQRFFDTEMKSARFLDLTFLLKRLLSGPGKACGIQLFEKPN
jgi:hypothetical protein